MGYSEFLNTYLNVSDEAKLMNIFKVYRQVPIYKSMIVMSVHIIKKDFPGFIIYNRDWEAKTTKAQEKEETCSSVKYLEINRKGGCKQHQHIHNLRTIV